MKFTLTYSGRLPGSSNAAVKHGIRRAFHPQLQELWRTHPALAGKQNYMIRRTGDGETDGDGALLETVGGRDYVALVHPFFKLYAELDILLLRPEALGVSVSHAGDIDNQLKTLFDALRRPTDAGEVPRSWVPAAGEEPLHCLLDDDKLITRANVDTDRLLLPGGDPKDVSITIRVAIKGTALTWGNMSLIA
jgi:hypothetical protein